MSCKDCKKGYIEGQKSLISSPKCNGDCPEDVGCPFPVYTNCIIYSGPDLSCLGVNNGDDFSVALANLETLCENSTGNSNACKVSINSDDTCCGYLSDKIASDTLDITTVTSGRNCLSLKVEEKLWTFNAITPLNGWINQPGFVAAQIAVKNDEVRFRGQIQFNSNLHTSPTTVFNLAASARPSVNLQFNYVARDTYGVNTWLVSITIETTGAVKFSTIRLGSTSTDLGIRVSLDFLNYVK